MVLAADKREAKAGTNQEMWWGDGAAALLLGDCDVIAAFEGSHSVTYDFVDHYRSAQHRFDYNWEERWIRDEGYARIIPEAIRGLLDKLSLTIDQIDKLVYPCYSKGQHAAIGRSLGASRDRIVDNMHEVCGETGAAHPLVMLVDALEQSQPGERILVAGFGQGCDALCFRVTDEILRLSSRRGIKGSLTHRRPMDNYLKYLNFRGLIETDADNRSETQFPTSMSILWRKRKVILGLVGGRCQVCGTPQYPRMDICINPECGAVGTQEDYEFADVPATVKSFSADQMTQTADPPFISGIVQFEGGGRLIADFSDCDLTEVKVGMPVTMSFRQHHVHASRGITGYFWKAVPQVGG